MTTTANNEKQGLASQCLATMYADNMALPAVVRRCRSNRSIYPACRAHSSKHAVTGFLTWAHAGTDTRTDRQTDGRTPYHFIDPAVHTMQAVPPSQGCCDIGSCRPANNVLQCGLACTVQRNVSGVSTEVVVEIKITPRRSHRQVSSSSQRWLSACGGLLQKTHHIHHNAANLLT